MNGHGLHVASLGISSETADTAGALYIFCDFFYSFNSFNSFDLSSREHLANLSVVKLATGSQVSRVTILEIMAFMLPKGTIPN